MITYPKALTWVYLKLLKIEFLIYSMINEQYSVVHSQIMMM